MAKYEIRDNHFTNWQDYQPGKIWGTLLEQGFTFIRAEDTWSREQSWVEVRKVIEPFKCTHENYTCSTTQLFKNGKAMDGQIHSYVCADCGVASSELRTLKLK